MVKKLFGDWEKGNIPVQNHPKPQNVETTEINFVNMPNAVQSEVVLMNNIELQLGDNDYYAALLANQILGGGGTARLFQNLREDKGYTYGSYSSVRQSRNAATFRASASVRNMVTDSSVVEMLKEVNRIRYQKVSAKDLKDAKEKYIGSFVMDVQKPATAARYALNIARYNLPEDYYANYLDKINNVTVDDVQNAAIKYFRADKARIIITGKGIEVLKNLEKGDYKISYFDEFANPTKKPEMTMPIPAGVTAATVVDNYIKAIGGNDNVSKVESVVMVSTAKVQGIDVTLTQKSAAPNKSSLVVEGMGMVFQKVVFDGEKGYQEAQGRRKDMGDKEIAEAKATAAPFGDMAYKNGTLDRIEPVDGKYAYVIKHNKTEIFYDKESGLKIKEVRTAKGPQGEVKIPTTFSDYKAVNGVKFPHKIGQKMGPADLNFTVKEVKINEGVSDADFK